MQFIVTGLDGDDEGALDRRMSAREMHLEKCRESAAAGELLYAAAITDDAGVMRGSVMIVDYPTRAELEEWLKNEPYVTAHVWRDIDIRPCKVASIFQPAAKDSNVR
ncbi:MAG: hypothetical protein EOM26_01375 [Alphaproteobacteria bacterium]|nr:hypothetical protein [Alphaproteobacteria bacterium]